MQEIKNKRSLRLNTDYELLAYTYPRYIWIYWMGY